VAFVPRLEHRFGGRFGENGGDFGKIIFCRRWKRLHRCASSTQRAHPIIAEGPLCSASGSSARYYFLATRRLSLGWRQVSQKRSPEVWSLKEQLEPSGFAAQTSPGSVGGNDLALLVSVASNVEPAFAASRPQLPAFRGMVVVTKPGDYPHDIDTPGKAADIVRVIAEGLRRARDTFQPRGSVHLFLAVPAGLCGDELAKR